jgi:hypothetical protein
LLGRGFRPRIGLSPSEDKPDHHQLSRHPYVAMEVK